MVRYPKFHWTKLLYQDNNKKKMKKFSGSKTTFWIYTSWESRMCQDRRWFFQSWYIYCVLYIVRYNLWYCTTVNSCFTSLWRRLYVFTWKSALYCSILGKKKHWRFRPTNTQGCAQAKEHPTPFALVVFIYGLYGVWYVLLHMESDDQVYLHTVFFFQPLI